MDASAHRSPSAVVTVLFREIDSDLFGPRALEAPSARTGPRSGASSPRSAWDDRGSLAPSYDGRGASAEFSLLLLLRRIRTLGRPTVAFLDQVGLTADLSRVLRPLAQPERLMPEGSAGLPPILVVAAGQRDAFPEGLSLTC